MEGKIQVRDTSADLFDQARLCSNSVSFKQCSNSDIFYPRFRPQINVHYFEEGNVQLNTTHKCTLEVPGAAGADADKLASAIVDALKKEEVEFHSQMEARAASFCFSYFCAAYVHMYVCIAIFLWCCWSCADLASAVSG